MTAQTQDLKPWRSTHRAAWAISVSVLAAVATIVTVLVFMTTRTTHHAQQTKPGVTYPPPPGRSVIYDCLPTHFIHPC